MRWVCVYAVWTVTEGITTSELRLAGAWSLRWLLTQLCRCLWGCWSHPWSLGYSVFGWRGWEKSFQDEAEGDTWKHIYLGFPQFPLTTVTHVMPAPTPPSHTSRQEPCSFSTCALDSFLPYVLGPASPITPSPPWILDMFLASSVRSVNMLVIYSNNVHS